MGYQELYSWQVDDWDLLTDSLEHRVVFVHGKDFESKQNIAAIFYKEIEGTGDYKIFPISCKDTHCVVPFMPIYDCFLQFEIKKEIKIEEIGKNIIKDVTGSGTIEYLMNINEALCKNALSTQYRDILIFVEELSQEISPIFILHNFSNYDSESQILIQWMASGQLDKYYPFLKNARFIFLCDNNEDIKEYNELCTLQHIDLDISEPNDNSDIVEIWSRYSPHTCISTTDAQKIYSFSGGKLSNIELIVQYLCIQKKIEWSGDDFTEFMTGIFDKRLTELKNSKDAVRELLETASGIGQRFNLRWLNYSLSESIQNQYDILLRKCCTEQFITCQNDIGTFSSIFAWEYFHNCSPHRKKELALMLAKTVNYFCPYDYYLRAVYTEQTEDYSTALDLYLYEYWKRLKENLKIPSELSLSIATLSNKHGNLEYTKLLDGYYESLSNGLYNKALTMLETSEGMDISSLRLQLLRDYLLACIYHKVGRDMEMIKRSILLMEQIVEQAKQIGEMDFWSECLATLLSFYANSGDTSRALSISKELMYYYSQRKDYDTKAIIGMHVLNRKSSAFFSVEIAAQKTEKSAIYFRNSLLYTQYLMALNNHAANLFVLGMFDRSMEYIQEAISFITKHPTVKINPIYIWNNYYLSAFYCDKSDKNVLLQGMSQMVNDMEDTELKIIPLINLAICHVLAEKSKGINPALEYLNEAAQLNIELLDDYYEYYIHANFASVYFLLKQYEDALKCMLKCMIPPSLMKSTEKIYLKKRTDKWLDIIKEQKNIAIEEFDTYLLEDSQGETAWQFLGRGFLPSDLQFWSDS